MIGAPVLFGERVGHPPRAYTLVEPCCGLASLTLHLLGARRAVLPYQGSKWRYRHALASLLGAVGAVGAPTRVELDDAGPAKRVMGTILGRATRHAVVEELGLLDRLDARAVYGALHNQRAPQNEVAFAAQFLFLQRLAFSGKAVGLKGGVWQAPGFNARSAYGHEATPRFGAIKPMIGAVIDALRGYDFDVAVGLGARTDLVVTYIDPPYRQGTRYPGGHLHRPDVAALALAALDRGRVLVSEAEPVEELLARGWTARRLGAQPGHAAPFRGKHEEWVTLSPGWSEHV